LGLEHISKQVNKYTSSKSQLTDALGYITYHLLIIVN